MTAEERIAQLEAELATERAEKAAMRTEMAELRAEVAVLHQQMEHVLAYATELEGRLAKDSHNSSKPPSSDGPSRQTRHQRKTRGKKAGGQAGHEGRTLMQVAIPDEILSHRPGYCAHCQQSLQEDPGQVKERRQVMDLPLLRLRVVEHQAQEVCCAHCQQLTVADFPAGVEAPVQYGPNVRALAI